MSQSFKEIPANNQTLYTFFSEPSVQARELLHQPCKTGIHFAFQWLVALLCFCCCLPLLLLAGILLRIESPGPIIFSQYRVGINGRRFRCYKLRSMYLPNDARYIAPDFSKSDRTGPCKKLFRDPRVSKIGRIVRKLSIDELPQLFNVLKGDMALVGPRPALVSEVEQYKHHHLNRSLCRPGITGLWQISGRADIDFETQIELDLNYVNNRSVGLDLYILLRTFPAVLSMRGAY